MRAEIRIVSIEATILDLPTIRPHTLSMVTMNRQSMTIVRVRCSDGIEGLGEGTTIGGLAYGPESPEGMKLTIDEYIAPLLLGCDPTRVQATMDRVRKAVKGNHFAKCAVESALLDCQARRLGVPMSELLGGRRREKLPVAWTLASGDTAKDIDEAQALLDRRRHKDFKLKIGVKSIKEDIRHVAAIRKALPDMASVRVDVNMAWREREARNAIAALSDAGCVLVEQPVGGVAPLARLTRVSPIAMMADEVLVGPESALEAVTAHAADVFSIKIEQAGGLFAAAKVIAIAETAGIGVYGGTMLEGPIGTIAAAQLMAGVKDLQWGTEFFGPLLLTEEILATPLDYSDFELTVPQGPGLGIELDEDRVAFFVRGRMRKTISIAG
ncbi:muconate/chloromuconate family cycloisomerase [Rhizobium leguminosarum]|uniref:muconate/chloromuconate family cycloisomerase n=1 Tax=Rhizobium leguminosarum TaxID=384 RepID=UPI0010304D6E|nr:muconate/chloromuconate family cycloisomerase [Rhizobium leguminosarum]MDV4159869.1 muconate/chloromuconate family cycloisomerase [Rhizobium leguminosarum]MDV4170997.1 muconate/chloromuconate family cycloisomerase [Rhizobium leguminosarum]NKK46722.1 muconate cycloisomerase [Rhizobium leguminosarum bv. viciae]QIO72529.1 muconate cycloisomerase [Rhizobium leguminosarum bv. trifolii]QIO79548.1 muconate cycloisomerase [Rhizobium leguminosarum bv. trifolii]